jgi:DNA repair exonuclease SbcCD ATPase subunit
MHTISNTVERKFINSIDLSNLEIETDSGWQPVTAIHKTIPYNVWKIETSSGLSLDCADTHILFDKNFNEIFVKDIIEYQTEIITKNGPDLVTKVSKTDVEENMFDLTVDHPDHRFYTNGILSHNSTIINALSYALFGQALTNIKKNNLINKTNSKGMVVTLQFEKNGINYRIERGRSPTFTKFFINNQEFSDETVDESQGDSRKTQEAINEILGMSHDMFKHIVALNTYSEPFLSMKTHDQRAIIEQLLGITILSEKAVALKEQIKLSKDAITEETLKINAIKASNEKINASIKSFETRQSAWLTKHKEDCKKLKNSINELEHLDIDQELKNHELLDNWIKINTEIKNLKKEQSTLDLARSRALISVEKITQDIQELDNALCYTCGQTLHEDKKQIILEEKEKELVDFNNYLDDINKKLETVNQRLDSIGDLPAKPQTFYETAKEAYEHRSNVENLKQTLLNKEAQDDPYHMQIQELKETAIQVLDWTPINELSTYLDHQEFLLKLLTNKDSFIRKKIIDQNLAYLNNRLTYYLDRIGLPHQVKFLNDLNVEITQFGQDLDFDNLSRGERNRLILGLSFAFRDVWESLYDNINLLFIDELIDNGLDLSGVENSLLILKKMSRDQNKNIFLISHRDELKGRVNNILKVIKEGGFTTYENSAEVVE